jgi:GDPmannose 4,6-dehydratase
MKKAIITGITGQDGSYLAEYLLNLGYEVCGIVRRVSTPNYTNINHIIDVGNLKLVDGDITDISSLIRIFKKEKPDEIYNLAAQSFVAVSWNQPQLTANITGIGALNVFEAARLSCPSAKIYQASSSEMYDGTTFPQTENTPYKPRSPYGVSKLFAHEMARIYRESYGMFISCGILFNHESPRRGIEFVTQKVVDTVVRQMCGEDVILELGNMSAKRDWSHARDMVKGMHLMLQQKKPDDYILASGETHSIFEFVNKVYEYFKIDIIWLSTHSKIGENLPIGVDVENKVLVRSIDKYYRPNEVSTLLGDSFRARKELGWKPKYSFTDLVMDMVESKVLEYKGGE